MGPISQQNSTRRVGLWWLAIAVLILPLTAMCMSGRGWAQEKETFRVIILNNTSEQLALECYNPDGPSCAMGWGIDPGCCPNLHIEFQKGVLLTMTKLPRPGEVVARHKVTGEPNQRFVVNPPSSKSAE